MPRARVKLAWIGSESARRASFNKRKDGLVKKVIELSTLCDVPACIIIYGRGSNQPIVWPDRPRAEEVIRRYLRLPGYVRCKKTLSQESYLKEKVAKMEEKHNKTLRSNTMKDMDDLMRQGQNGKPLYELDINQTNGLLNFVEEKMKEIQNQFAFSEQAGGPSYTSVHNEPANNLGVPLGTGMEWPYGIFGVGGDGSSSGTDMGFPMLPQCYGNNIGGSSSVNVVPNMIPYNGNIGNFGGDGDGSVGLPQADYLGNDITGNGSQMGYFGMLPQYYGANVITSNGSIIGWAIGNTNGANSAGEGDAAGLP
ncbi:agamous-like MADS-box protein AGL80 [Rosa rugosa]|uniref:agamous-like MADS-box protein AGL80 n=1 Tax=Rosa rugosa TaxID=74645 RepID=UPI002B40CF80|nr:agamous-like MADS-box protein AGL80 [Rosa rugosa]